MPNLRRSSVTVAALVPINAVAYSRMTIVHSFLVDPNWWRWDPVRRAIARVEIPTLLDIMRVLAAIEAHIVRISLDDRVLPEPEVGGDWSPSRGCILPVFG